MNLRQIHLHHVFSLGDRVIEATELQERFPGLAGPDVLLDNAGGSQVPSAVVDRIAEYLCESFVQLGAAYPSSLRAAGVVERAREFLRVLMGAEEGAPIVIGPSTTALCNLLAESLARAPRGERDELVLCEAGHEANLGAWARLEERGYRVRWWRADPRTGATPLAGLAELLSERTRLVAVHHVSNLLGGIEDVAQIARMAHAVGARVVVDGVAYAPHRAMAVAEWDVDWYVFSAYKVYGPHMAALYGKREAFAELAPPAHFFLESKGAPQAFEPGGVQHELCAGLLGVYDHLAFLAGEVPGQRLEREVVERGFEQMVGLERPLQERLIGFVREHPDLRLIGPPDAGASRVPTVSFVHRGRSSREIALAANAQGLGIRYGHFYAHRLCRALGLDPDDGVVRASLVHYNTPDELDRLLTFLG